MPTNTNQNTPNHDEIDLLTLFTKLGEFTKKALLGLINLIGSILVFLLRKWYYFGIAAILTVATALILNNISDPYYYTDLIMRSNATNNQPIMTSLEKLGAYADEGNSAALSDKLNLSTEVVSAIKGLETFWYYDIGEDGIYDGIDTDRRYLSDTSVVMVEDEFIIRAAIYDPGILKKFEDGLVHYLEANPIFEALNKQRLSDLEARINQTQYEIEKLDSLQKREYYTNTKDLRQSEGQIVFTSEKVVQTYHNEMFRLLQRIQNFEKDLNIYYSVVTVIEGFAVPVKPDNGFIEYAKKVFWLYLGLALLLAVVITYRKKIWIH